MGPLSPLGTQTRSTLLPSGTPPAGLPPHFISPITRRENADSRFPRIFRYWGFSRVDSGGKTFDSGGKNLIRAEKLLIRAEKLLIRAEKLLIRMRKNFLIRERSAEKLVNEFFRTYLTRHGGTFLCRQALGVSFSARQSWTTGDARCSPLINQGGTVSYTHGPELTDGLMSVGRTALNART